MTTAATTPAFGAIIIGDEILSGRRADKHLAKLIELLGARGLSLAYAHHVGDERSRITRELKQAFESSDVVFSFGGIGATPDDHTRQCAAAALGQKLVLHPIARDRIEQRMRELAMQQGSIYQPDHPDNRHRLNMGVFPESATVIENPYNRIPGFTCAGPGGGVVHFVPGFPVMAWPMIESVLDDLYQPLFAKGRWLEKSVIVYGAMEASLTPLMERIEAQHAGVKVFSLPSVDHPVHGRHIELGVKGDTLVAEAAFGDLRESLVNMGVSLGPESVQD